MKVAYLNHTYPQLTQTFVYREVQALRRAGLDVATLSFKKPATDYDSKELADEMGRTVYLPATNSPRFWLMALAAAFRHIIRTGICKTLFWKSDGNPVVKRSLKRFLLDLSRGLMLARYLKSHRDITHVHAPFSTEASTSLLMAAKIMGISFSFRNHTCYDAAYIREKLAACDFALSISEFDREMMTGFADDKYGEKIHIVHCGIQPDQWQPQLPPIHQRRILSVGSLAPKKGHGILIEACRILKERGVEFSCDIVGGGPLMDSLKSQIEQSGLKGMVMLHGPQPQEKVKNFFENARVFALACLVTDEGDLDGIPVVLMEAMAMGKVCVSTKLSGIPELITSEEEGLLAEPSDATDFADKLERALTDDDLIVKTSEYAPKKVQADFNLETEAQKLGEIFHWSAKKLR